MTDPNPTTRMPLPGQADHTADPGSGPGSGPGFAAVPPPAAPPAGAGWPPPSAARWSGRSGDGRSGSMVFGLIVLGIGLWFFAEHTLGLELPAIRWSQFWPVILIVIGAWVVLASVRSRGR